MGLSTWVHCLYSISKNYIPMYTMSRFCHKMWWNVFKVWWSFQKKGTLEIIFPHSGVLVLKRSSFYADFALRGFSLPPKIRGEQGPPVDALIFNKVNSSSNAMDAEGHQRPKKFKQYKLQGRANISIEKNSKFLTLCNTFWWIKGTRRCLFIYDFLVAPSLL